MPPVDRRLIQAIIATFCVVCLAGCGVNVTNQTNYWLPKASDGNYTLTLRVEPSSGVQVDGVWVTVNSGGEQGMRQDPTTRTKWTFTYKQTTDRALKVKYRVAYTVGSPFAIVAPGQRAVTLPKAGEWVVPILSAGADSDADGSADSFDNCVYQPNANQAHGSSFSALALGVPCNDAGAPSGPPNGFVAVYQVGAPPDVTFMQDNRANFMLVQGGANYYAFQLLVSSIGQVVGVRGVNGLSDAVTARIAAHQYPPWKVEISDCKLVYQDRSGGDFITNSLGQTGKAFIEVYAAKDAHPCTFAITQDGQALLAGHEVLITVRTNVDLKDDPDQKDHPSPEDQNAPTHYDPNAQHPVPAYGHAMMFGRVTLNAPPPGGPQDGVALYNALTRGSDVHYAYFSASNFGATANSNGRDYCTRDSPPSAFCVTGTFAAAPHFVFPP